LRGFFCALAGIPKTPRGAVALLTSLIFWGLSLIFIGLVVLELAHRFKGMDDRPAGAERRNLGSGMRARGFSPLA
jgi:short subunit fatty acids transporter